MTFSAENSKCKDHEIRAFAWNFLRNTKEASIFSAEGGRVQVVADKSSEGSDYDFWNLTFESRAPMQTTLIWTGQQPSKYLIQTGINGLEHLEKINHHVWKVREVSMEKVQAELNKG